MRTLKGLGALALLMALLVGIPLALIALAGNPIPAGDELMQALTGIDFGGRVLMGTILPLIGWAAWASFAVSVVIELAAQVRNVRTPRLKGLGAQQALAGALVAAVLTIGGGAPALAQPALDLETGTATQSTSQTLEQQDTPTAGEQAYTVRAGDTLSGIARDQLGDETRWPELAEQMKGAPQADGRTLEDPNLIYEGWQVSVPAGTGSTAAAPALPAPAPQEDPAAPQAVPAPTPSQQEAAPAPAAADAPAAEQAPTQVPGVSFTQPAAEAPQVGLTGAQDAAEDEGEDVIDWRTLGGIGSILAAGVLGVIGARRFAQRRRRKPGQQVPMPAGQDAQIEAQLMTVADQPAVDELDLVLRTVSVWAAQEQVSLPEMFCVRVTDEQIALYLAAAAELPEPFVREEQDGTVWSIESGQIDSLPYLPAAPYPALVTVGKDDTGAQMLLDLEYLATLGLEGDPALVAEALDAMAVELATSSWGEELTVTLVGVAPGLASAIGTERVRQVDDLDELLRLLAGKAADVRAALDEAGMESTHQAKGSGIEQDWAPEIVLLGIDPTDEQADQLRELTQTIPRLGVAAVTIQNPLSAQWRLEMVDEDNADLEPAGLHLTPQRITADEAQRIMSVLSTALADPQDADGVQTHTVDLSTILGRPASHLAVVPDTGAETEGYNTVPDEDTATDALDQAATDQAPGETEEETTAGAPEIAAAAEQGQEHPAAAAAARENGEAEAADPQDPQAKDDAEGEESAELEAPEVQITVGAAEEFPAVPSTVSDDATVPAAQQTLAEPAEESEAVTTAAEPIEATSPEPAEEEEPQEEPAAALITRLAPATEESELDQQASALLDEVAPSAPLVAMLGEMRVFGARGEAPMSRSTGEVSTPRMERCVALAAFLALRQSATAEAYHAAFWPNAETTGATASSNRNKLAAVTRKMLGQDEAGAHYFPRTTAGDYRLDERVTTDWHLFTTLVGDDPTAASTPALVAAMRLVRGAPFQHAKSKNVAWADDLHQEMVEVICDAAHELVHRSLRAGHHGHAQLGARVGRIVDPANEAAWRDAITAEAAAGNREEVARLVEQLYAWLEAFEEGLEPEEETTELIDQLREHGYRVVA